MAKVKFYLTDINATNETKLFTRISYGLFEVNEKGTKKYLPLKYPTKIIIPSKVVWDNIKNRVIDTKEADVLLSSYEKENLSVHDAKLLRSKRAYILNSQIADIESTVNSVILELSKEGYLPSHDVLKSKLDAIFFPEKLNNNGNVGIHHMNFLQYIDHIITTSNNKESTLRSYKVVRKNINDFQNKYNRVLTYKNVDIDFYNEFIKYLTTSLNLSKNTIGTRIKILKTFLNMANEQGVNVNRDYQKRAFSKPSEVSENIYLNIDELNQMYKLNGLSEYLERVRDLFIFGADCGLRYSDLVRISKENITDNDTILIRTQKTSTTIETPITPRMYQILEKYNYELPKISNQKYNQYLKDVARMANINERVSITSTKGGLLVTKNYEKWELVTAHTSRRAFATNAYLNNVPTLAIMAITGHKTESAFLKYIKVTNKENARKLQLHPFFTQMTIAK